MTVQVLVAKEPARAGAQAEDRARVEAEWAGRLQQARAGIVSARAAEQRFLMLLDSPATQEAALNVVRQ